MTITRDNAVKVMGDNGLTNPGAAYDAALAVGLPLAPACALLAKESGGRNVYGHDQGGTFAGFPGAVNEGNWEVFWWLVDTQGAASNGVGPCQLTYPGFFRQMIAAGLRPWVARDNMRFGFGLLKGYYDTAAASGDKTPWVTAGTRYNGAAAYGVDLAARVTAWHTLFDAVRTK